MKSILMLIKNREVIRHFVKNQKRILKSYVLNIYFRGEFKAKVRTFSFGISKLILVSMNNEEISLEKISEHLFNTSTDEEIVLDNYIIQKIYFENCEELNKIEEAIIDEKSKLKKFKRNVFGIMCYNKKIVDITSKIGKEKNFFFDKNRLILRTSDSSTDRFNFSDMELIGVRLKKKEIEYKNKISNKVYRRFKKLIDSIKQSYPNTVIILKDDLMIKDRIFGKLKPKLLRKYKGYYLEGVIAIENGELKMINSVNLQKIIEDKNVRYTVYGFNYIGSNNIRKTVKIERIDESFKNLIKYFI